MKSTVLAFTFLAACAAEVPDVSESTQLLKFGEPGIDDDGGMCPSWGCGSNSPLVDLERFHDLHELGLRNDQGYSLVSFQKEYPAYSGTWRNYKPRVRNGILTAWTNGGTVNGMYYPPMQAWANNDLINMRFLIQHEDGHYLYIYVNAIDDAPWFVHPSTMPNFAGPSGAKTYQLTWNAPPQRNYAGQKTKIPVCGQSLDDDGILPFHAVLFEEDRISSDELKVTGIEAGWFNIGCKGHTLAKLHLYGRTKAAQYWMGATTSINERTAMIKMLAGDYCGNGHPFTVAGVPLQIKDSRGWYNDIDHAYGFEAKWNQNGATCLNMPRYDWQTRYGTTFETHGTFDPDVETLLQTAVDGWCDDLHPRPPPCSTSTQQDPFYSGGYFVSVNSNSAP